MLSALARRSGEDGLVAGLDSSHGIRDGAKAKKGDYERVIA